MDILKNDLNVASCNDDIGIYVNGNESNDSSVDSVLYDPNDSSVQILNATINHSHNNSPNSSDDFCPSSPTWSASTDSMFSNESQIQTATINRYNETNTTNHDRKNVKVYRSYSATNSPFLSRRHQNLVSENGSIIWDSDWDWIQRFDRMLRIGSQRKIERSCGCSFKRNNLDNGSKVSYSANSSPKAYRSAPSTRNRSNLANAPNSNCNNANTNCSDEVDFKKVNSFKRATSAPPVKRNAILNKLPSSVSTKSSGAADEEMFMNAFEDVPRVQIFSAKDLEKELNIIRDTCSNSNMEWEKRIECLRKFRSLLVAGAPDYEEFYLYLKPLEVPFQTSVKDLRSQVVREACISIAYLSQRIGNKCDRFAEALLPTLIDSIQNSAKIMSSSAVVAIRFVIQHTHTTRLIPIITYNISSKSREIRKACCEFLDQLLHTWPSNTVERHVGLLQEAIKKGISDADPEARALARKAFWGFADKFKAESDYLLSSLDSNKQKMLHGEQMSNWSSTNSLNKVSYGRPIITKANSVSTNGSIESINRQCSNLVKRSAIPIPSPKPTTASPRTPIKATSAIDIDAQKRARAKANVYLNQPKAFLNSVYTLNHQKRNTPQNDHNVTPMNDTRRSASKKSSRVSKSQPGSRSASPSSRLNCYNSHIQNQSSAKPKRTSLTSRDQSPARTHNSATRFERKLSSSSTATSRSKSYLTSSDLDLSNRILTQNDEQMIENAFAMSMPPRKRYFDDQSDESETSSICSDTSFANYGVRKLEDISKILENLSSSHWTDKKDGLLSLNNFLRYSDERLNSFQLKRITDIFTRMLVDPHTKAFALFLNTLNELIHIYKSDLNSWLYILMTRLFLKVGSDTLGSIQTRILKTFELIRESFPIEDQFNVIMRLLSDQTQTLNTKVKIAVLQYLSKLIFLMDSSDFTCSRPNHHDIQNALVKIISWTADIKSSDLRKISQETIVDLYNLNSAEMTLYLNELRKTFQDAAFQIIQHKHKTRLSQSSPSSMMQTPCIVKNIGQKAFYDSGEHLNPADIYDSLKKTSDEIQKYSFNLDSENISSTPVVNNYNNVNVKNSFVNHHHHLNNSVVVDANRRMDALSNASLDSGISQNSAMMMHDLTPNSGTTNRTLKMFNANNHSHTSPPTNGYKTPPIASTTNGDTIDNITKCFNTMSLDDNSYQQNLLELIHYIKNSSSEEISSNFKNVFQTLLTKLQTEKNHKTKVLLLRTIGEILFKSHKRCMEEFAELTLITLIELVCRDEDKEVVKVAEETANYAVYNFDSITSFKILLPFINHQEFTLNIISIKILTKVVELANNETVNELLPELMPPLLQAYDNQESAVRKTAVFCMVAIAGATGDAINSYLASLSQHKLKLLRLYIDRYNQQTASTSTTAAPTTNVA